MGMTILHFINIRTFHIPSDGVIACTAIGAVDYSCQQANRSRNFLNCPVRPPIFRRPYCYQPGQLPDAQAAQVT
jgi:hypothetical protein